MTKMFTLQDSRQEKMAMDAKMEARSARRAKPDSVQMMRTLVEQTKNYPPIGILMKNGVPTAYIFRDGREIIDTPENLIAILKD